MSAAAESSNHVPFEAMGLAVETPVKLLRRAPGESVVTHGSAVIGFLRDRYLLLKLPLAGGLTVRFLEGETLEVRLFTGRSAFSFDSRVQRVHRAPLNCLQLELPERVWRTPVRNADRIDVDLSAELRGDGAEQTQAARIVNLSATGAMLAVPAAVRLATGASISLRFDLHGERSPVAIEALGVVRNVRSPGSDAQPPDVTLVGVEYDGLAELARLAIANYIYRRRFGEL